MCCVKKLCPCSSIVTVNDASREEEEVLVYPWNYLYWQTLNILILTHGHWTVHSAIQVLSKRTTMIISNMKAQMDPTKYEILRYTCIQHNIIKRMNQNWSSVDTHSRREVNSIKNLLEYMTYAYSRQYHTLGVNSFVKSPEALLWEPWIFAEICRPRYICCSSLTDVVNCLWPGEVYPLPQTTPASFTPSLPSLRK